MRIGFLGLRILLTCYGEALTRDWVGIAGAIRKFGQACEQSVALWKLLDYVDVYRTPLYNLLLSFMRSRVGPGLSLALHSDSSVGRSG